MQITINIDDKWIEEQSLDEALIDAIRAELLRDLVAKFRPDVTKMFEEVVDSLAKERIAMSVKATLDDFVAEGRIKPRGESEYVLVKDYLERIFTNNNTFTNPTTQLAQMAKNAGDQLKKRYDLQFATLIVDNMRQHGLLKDDVALMLTNGKS